MRTSVAAALPESRVSARDIAPPSSNAPVKLFAWLGVAWLIVLAYVFLRWTTADYFAPTPTGPDIPPVSTVRFIRILEAGVSLVVVWLIWECIVKPLRKDGEMNADGLFVVTWFTLWFHDPMLNWIVHVFSYNSYALNFGNWTAEIPGWLSPRSHLSPEPALAIGLSYIGQCTMGAWGAMYLMQACKERWPRTGDISLISIAVGSGMFMDWAAEHTMISFQLMSYLSTIPSLSLCAGTIYQFPLYEAVFFGGVVGFSGAMMYFKDDRGLTWAERGVDKLRIARSRGMRTLLRWLAMMGFLHSVMFFFYSVPMQLFAVNGGAFPQHVPSYLLNGVCGPGTPYPCASPLSAIPRRTMENAAGRR